MKIERIIHGERVEIELTQVELNTAYWTAEEFWDKGYVLDLAEMEADGAEDEEAVKRYEALKSDPQLLAAVAKRYRKYMDEQITAEEEFSCFNWAYEFVTENR